MMRHIVHAHFVFFLIEGSGRFISALILIPSLVLSVSIGRLVSRRGPIGRRILAFKLNDFFGFFQHHADVLTDHRFLDFFDEFFRDIEGSSLFAFDNLGEFDLLRHFGSEMRFQEIEHVADKADFEAWSKDETHAVLLTEQQAPLFEIGFIFVATHEGQSASQ